MPNTSIPSLPLNSSHFFHREISADRINRITHAHSDEAKSEALRMGLWDIFKDLFCENKKADFLEKLWQLSHANDFDAKADVFVEIKRMVDYGAGVEFGIGLEKADDGAAVNYYTTFVVKIDDNPVELCTYQLADAFTLSKLYDVKPDHFSVSLGRDWLECALAVGSKIENAIFRDLDLAGLDFRGKKVSDIDFSGCDLRGVKFDDTTEFSNVNLTNAKILQPLYDQVKNSKLSIDAVPYTETQIEQWKNISDFYSDESRGLAEREFYVFSKTDLPDAERVLAFWRLQNLAEECFRSTKFNESDIDNGKHVMSIRDGDDIVIAEDLKFGVIDFFDTKNRELATTALCNLTDISRSGTERTDSFVKLRDLAKPDFKDMFVFNVIDSTCLQVSIKNAMEVVIRPIQLTGLNNHIVKYLNTVIIPEPIDYLKRKFEGDLHRSDVDFRLSDVTAEFRPSDKTLNEDKLAFGTSFIAGLESEYKQKMAYFMLYQIAIQSIHSFYGEIGVDIPQYGMQTEQYKSYSVTQQKLSKDLIFDVTYSVEYINDSGEITNMMGYTMIAGDDRFNAEKPAYTSYCFRSQFVVGPDTFVCTRNSLVRGKPFLVESDGQFRFLADPVAAS